MNATQRIGLAFRFFASGSFFQITGDSLGVDKSTTCRTVNDIIAAILQLVPQYISTRYFDSDKNIAFFREKGLPNVCGAVDDTHINISATQDFKPEYVIRKGNNSLNVQMIGTRELLICDVVADWPGRIHDLRILNESGIYQQFQDGMFGNRILLGDQGYALSRWLFTPVVRAQLTPHERRFNGAHKSARNSIERMYGVLKRRWACLRGLRCKTQKAAWVIMTSAVLHNYAILHHEPEPADDGDADLLFPEDEIL